MVRERFHLSFTGKNCIHKQGAFIGILRHISTRWRSRLTVTLEAGRGRGEQQFVLHAGWASAGGNAWLLVPVLDPVHQPLETTVAVQGVVTQRPVDTNTVSEGS